MPLDYVLTLNVHLLLTKFISDVLGTKVHVWLACRASISSCLAFFQWGSRRAWWYEEGYEGCAVRSARKHTSIWCLVMKNVFGLRLPIWAHVSMGWICCGKMEVDDPVGEEGKTDCKWVGGWKAEDWYVASSTADTLLVSELICSRGRAWFLRDLRRVCS
jgi:hypothetical protein